MVNEILNDFAYDFSRATKVDTSRCVIWREVAEILELKNSNKILQKTFYSSSLKREKIVSYTI